MFISNFKPHKTCVL